MAARCAWLRSILCSHVRHITLQTVTRPLSRATLIAFTQLADSTMSNHQLPSISSPIMSGIQSFNKNAESLHGFLSKTDVNLKHNIKKKEKANGQLRACLPVSEHLSLHSSDICIHWCACRLLP